jgi:hypothetical protein
MTTKLDKVLYTAVATSTGGRDGTAVSSDGLLNVRIAPPKELGGPGGATNPEQLFAAGYSACFLSALKRVAGMQKIAVSADASITASPHSDGLRHQRQAGGEPARRGPRRGAEAGRSRAPGVSLLQRHARQYRSDHRAGLSVTADAITQGRPAGDQRQSRA